MATLSAAERDRLPDSAFAYIESGGSKDASGRTLPRSKRHYPVHDEPHIRAALSRIGQGARFAAQAKGKVMAAAKAKGIGHDDEASATGRSLESLYPEVRYIYAAPEIRSAGDGEPPHITGYAASFGKISRRLGGFVERVMPTAFNEARSASWPDVVCRYNHKSDMVLGTSGSGTLQLNVDERGLFYDVLPPNHRGDVLELIQRGDVRYSSFAFRCNIPGADDEWGVTNYNVPMRSLNNVALLDVAPVLDPAYRDTTATARNMTGAIESLASWVDADPVEVRSMLDAGQAMRFFTRTDRPSAKPVPDEVRGDMLDDPAVALRNWKFEDAPVETPVPGAPEDDEDKLDDTPAARSSDEILAHAEETRAMHNHATMCRKYTHGEPCVLGAGHGDECRGRCWGNKDGVPCSMADGHTGDHVPHAYDDGNGPGRGRPRLSSLRDGEEASEGEETRTLLGTEALAEVYALRAKLTPIS